jgi:hypothetical protein
MKQTLLIGVACLLLGRTLGIAQNTFGVYGVGNVSCGEWVSVASQTNRIKYLTFVTWVHGYVTGVGSMKISLKRTDSAGIEAWMDKYCAAHPLESVSGAARFLVDELGAPK